MHETNATSDETNATSGGSSGNLPDNQFEMFSALVFLNARDKREDKRDNHVPGAINPADSVSRGDLSTDKIYHITSMVSVLEIEVDASTQTLCGVILYLNERGKGEDVRETSFGSVMQTR
jgi:hypothetical protein